MRRRTWRRVWIVLGEGHAGLEVAAVVDRVWVQDEKGDVPGEDVVLVELSRRLASTCDRLWAVVSPYFHTDPFLLGENAELVHEDLLSHGD